MEEMSVTDVWVGMFESRRGRGGGGESSFVGGKITFGIFDILSWQFLTIFFQKFQIHH